MKILYDHQMFSRQKYGGITRYFCELIRHLPPEREFELALLFSDNHYLQENRPFFRKRNILPDAGFKGKVGLKKKLRKVNQFYARHRIAKSNYDILHPTFYDGYFLEVLKKPYIITVHDLIAFKYNGSGFFGGDNIVDTMRTVITGAERIIAISQHTKQDLIELLAIKPEKIDVIYHGYQQALPPNRNNRFGDYLLFVGNRDGYKNFTGFAEAVSELLHREPNLKLICVGGALNGKEQAFLSELNMLDQVLVMSVDDRTLGELYANALAFVFPSRYEGFGMPILEAFANQCPICLSDASCFPEIAGDAGAYFDPTCRESILATVEKVIYDRDYAGLLIERGSRRLGEFDWNATARKTWAAYEKVLG